MEESALFVPQRIALTLRENSATARLDSQANFANTLPPVTRHLIRANSVELVGSLLETIISANVPG